MEAHSIPIPLRRMDVCTMFGKFNLILNTSNDKFIYDDGKASTGDARRKIEGKADLSFVSSLRCCFCSLFFRSLFVEFFHRCTCEFF